LSDLQEGDIMELLEPIKEQFEKYRKFYRGTVGVWTLSLSKKYIVMSSI
jgi:hypothetical protein